MSWSIPLSWNEINIINSSHTPATQLAGNATYYFFCRYLWQKATAMLDFKLPKNWNKNLFLLSLYGMGFSAVVDSGLAEYGVINQPGMPWGCNVFYQPRGAMISNPLLPKISGRELISGKDCGIIRLTPDWHGIGDLVGYYAEELALCAQSLNVNLFNSRLAYVFGAKNKQQAATFKKAMDSILSGEPAVVIGKSLFNDDGTPNWQPFFQNVKNTYIADTLLLNMRQLEAEFDTKIGIPSANTDKRERLISDEVNANNVETAALVSLWMDNVKESIEEVKALYPDLEISVDWRFKPDVERPEQSDPVGSGSV